jgi:hypothetical protein
VVLVALLTLVVLPLGLWGNPRFHVPALPLLAVSAAVPLSRLASRLRSRSVGTARGRADAQPAAAE